MLGQTRVGQAIVIAEYSARRATEFAVLSELAAERCGWLRLLVVAEPVTAIELCAPMAGLHLPFLQAERAREATVAALRAAHAVPDDVQTDYCVVQSWQQALMTVQRDRWDRIVVGRPSRLCDRGRLRHFAQSSVVELLIVKGAPESSKPPVQRRPSRPVDTFDGDPEVSRAYID